MTVSVNDRKNWLPVFSTFADSPTFIILQDPRLSFSRTLLRKFDFNTTTMSTLQEEEETCPPTAALQDISICFEAEKRSSRLLLPTPQRLPTNRPLRSPHRPLLLLRHPQRPVPPRRNPQPRPRTNTLPRAYHGIQNKTMGPVSSAN